MIAVALAVLLLQASFAPTPQPGTSSNAVATVDGVVLQAGSGAPLARAQITLVRIGPTLAAPDAQAAAAPRAVPATTTGVDGKFALKNIEPGSYRIAVARNGYARQEYGQRAFGGQGRVISLAPGQSITGIVLHLVPAGSVSGAVTDSSGEPLAGAQVQLLRSIYNGSGQRTLQAAGGDRTNDRGEYRAYWITPGRYHIAVIAAAPARGPATAGSAGNPNEVIERPYPTSYYPGTADVSQASAVDVQPGADMTGVDILVPDQQLFRVRGRVFDPSGSRQPDTASLSIVQRGSTAGPVGFSGSTAAYNPADGTFEIRDVAPGAYWLRATVADGPAAVVPPGAAGRPLTEVFVDSLFSNRRAAQVPLDVFGDLDGLALTLGSGVPIAGWLSVDSRQVSGIPDRDRVQVTLTPTTPGMIANRSRHRPIDREGAFTIENVLPGEYVVSVHGLPADYYIKDVRTDDHDALDRLLVSGRPRGTLSVVLGPAGGRVDGVVVDDRGRAVPGVQAALIPAKRPARADLYKTAITDGSGRFDIRGIPPGDYRVLAWESLEAFGYFDEDVARLSEPYGVSLRISGAPAQRVEVKVILISAQ
jgi:hypothetical protein